MKTKRINVIVEGRMSDADMQNLTGGGIFCPSPPPGSITTHINNCAMPEAGDISNPGEPGEPGVDPLNPCPTGYLNPPYCSPSPEGVFSRYIYPPPF